MPVRPRRAPLRALVATLLLLLGAGLTFASPAWAHSELTSSSPASGESLEQAPAQVTLTFSDAVIGNFTEVVVQAGAGAPVEAPAATSKDNIVTQPLPTGLAKGEYVVRYRVISADSHPISGDVRFTVTVGTAAAATTSPSAAATPSISTPPRPAVTLPPAVSTDTDTGTGTGDGLGTGAWLAVALGVIGVLAIIGLIVMRRRRSRS